MKSRFWKYILLFVIAIASVYFFVRTKDRPKDLSNSPTAIQGGEAKSNEKPVSATSTSAQPAVIAGNSAPPQTNDRDKPEAFKQSIEDMNSPIDFFGKIVDQDNNPVTGAKISVTIRQWYVRSITTFDVGAHFIPMESETGEDGRFEIHGKKGDGFGVGITKSGYQLSPKSPRGFGPTAGSLENPVIIKMWKRGEPAKLVSQDKDTRIPYDGTPVVFDLLTGQKGTGDSMTGDLRVILTRNPLSISLGYKNGFEWHAIIEAIDGGLIQSDDEFMYVAPENGYQPRIQIDMPAAATNWANIYNISFFAKTRGGAVYSRVKLVFRVDSPKPQTGFTITSSANPNGSRNLQP